MRKARILVVDDDENLRKQIVWALRDNFELLEAHDRKTAFQYLKEKRRPHILLLDLHLPPKVPTTDEGFAILRKFKKVAPDIKIIIISANSQEETVTKTRQLGADDYITKPFHLESLKRAIKRAISKPILAGAERRKHWRVPYELPVTYSLPSFPRSRKSKTINVSSGGVMFLVDHPITTDSAIDIRLSLPHKAVKATGKVKWAKKIDDFHHLGIQFSQIRSDDRKRLADYIYF